MSGKRKAEEPAPIKRLKTDLTGLKVVNSTVLLLWCRWKATQFGSLGRNVTREIGAYLQDPEFLPGIFNQRLYILNLLSHTLQFTSIPDSDDSFFIPLNPSEAACISLKDDIYDAFLVTYSPLEVTDLHLRLTHNRIDVICGCYIQDRLCLLVPRYLHFNSRSYVIYKYSFRERTWKETENKPISWFVEVTVPWENRIYMLFESEHSAGYLTYDIQTDQLTPGYSLGIPLYLHPFCPWVFLNNTKFLCLTKGRNPWMWDFRSNSMYGELEGQEDPVCETQGVTVLRGKEMHWLQYDQDDSNPTLITYNIETKTRSISAFRLESS